MVFLSTHLLRYIFYAECFVFVKSLYNFLVYQMPLPPALAARLAKRGILKTPVDENGEFYS